MFRTLPRSAAALGCAVYITHKHPIISLAESYKNWPFEPQGLPTEFTPTVLGQNRPMFLAGVGMRRKSVFMVDVDIYLVGIGLSEAAISKAKLWRESANAAKSNVINVLLDSTPKKSAEPVVSATLRFVRGITGDQMAEAFNDSFSDLNPDSVKMFKAGIRSIVGQKVLKGDEIRFFWMSDKKLVMEKGGRTFEMESADLSRRLLELYIDPARTVSKELSQCFSEHILELNA